MTLKNSWQLHGTHTNNTRPKDACLSALYTLNSLWNSSTKSTCWHGRHGSSLTPRATHKCLCLQNILSCFSPSIFAVRPFFPNEIQMARLNGDPFEESRKGLLMPWRDDILVSLCIDFKIRKRTRFDIVLALFRTLSYVNTNASSHENKQCNREWGVGVKD